MALRVLHPIRLMRRAAAGMNTRTVAAATAMTLTSTAIVIAAVMSDGSQATSVRLDDGSVWVTNEAAQRVGRLNIRIDELDLALVADVAPDVLQDGRSVAFSASTGGVGFIEVVSGVPSTTKNEIDIDDYRIGGGVGAVLDSETGRLWVGSSNVNVAPEFPKKADAEVAPGSRLVVTHAHEDRRDGEGQPRGKVLIVEPDGWYELPLDDRLEPVRPVEDPSTTTTVAPTTTAADPSGSVPDPEPDPIGPIEVQPLLTRIEATTQISAVGDRLVFLAADGSIFSTSGDVAKVPGTAALLQQVGPKADTALVASDAGLFEYRLGAAEVVKIAAAEAAPAAPVRVGSCAYGAWSGPTPTWFKACDGDVSAEGAPIEDAPADAKLVFRVNQLNVAINSTGDGGLWADHDGTLAYVGNWADVDDNAVTAEDEDATGESTRVAERQCVEGGAEAPTAGDDRLGARPRQSIIDVLSNDDDVNCEPIAIVEVDPSLGDWGTVTIVDNGQHLLFSPSDGLISSAASAVEAFSFTYVVEDSSGHRSAAANVSITVKDTTLGNAPPELRPKGNGVTRQMRSVVEAGRAVSYNVLADWWDPDGDDLRLESATPDGLGEVSTTPDGVVRYAANGVEASVQRVQVTVSDGIGAGTEPLEVTVKPSGSEIPPVAMGDFLTLVEGATGVVRPLDNDADPNEDILSLRPEWAADEAVGFRTRLVDEQTVEITGLRAGVYALNYSAWDGTDAGPATIRLRVIAPSETNTAPVAVPDVVKLRAGRVVNVDVLANDIDADGDLLAISMVDASNTGTERGVVRASMIDRRLLQVEVVPGPNGEPPTGSFVVTYVVEDGRTTERAAVLGEDEKVADALRARGAVTLVMQPGADDQPPVLGSDQAIVRTGDVVSIAVLQNDADPDGDAIVLQGPDAVQVAALEQAGDGVAWAFGRSIYFQGGTPGRKSLQYSVVANGKEATGEISIEVKPPPDPNTHPNQAPSPKPLELRAVRDAEVRLPIPLVGIDPDGDSVTLLDGFGGLPGAAGGNRVVLDPENPGTVLFTAGAAAGPADEFTYTVRDAFGAVGTGAVRVVVIDNGGWPPQAHDDVFRAKPGRTLSVPVLANDTSPQDARLELDELTFFDLEGQPVAEPQNVGDVVVLDQTKKESRGRIEVLVPEAGSTLSEHYRITDGTNPSDAWVRVTSDPETPNLPPVATLDVVPLAEVQGKQSAVVRVLDNDYDPDDATTTPTVSIPAGQNATVDPSGVVTVPLLETAQTVLYRLTDADGGTAVGVVRVPGKENHPPVLSANGKDADSRTIEAGAPDPISIRLEDIVEDPDGDPDIALTPTEIVVLGGQGQVTRSESEDGFTYLPPPDLTAPIRAALQFEVTDRPGLSAEARQETLCYCLATLSIDVVVQASSPPRVVAQGNVQVPQLDEPVAYDLGGLVTDDQDDPLEFQLQGGTGGGLDVTLDGSSVTLVSRQAGAEKLPIGTVIPVEFTVSDGKFDPVPGTLLVRIIATNRGRPAAASFPVQQAEREVPFDLPNVVSAAFNPFPDRQLTVVSPSADRGASVSCTPDGACRFRSDTVGTFTVSYTLKDAVDQSASGTINVVVKGKPRAPGTPRVESVGDKVVNLSWTAADMQGGDFVTYHVTAVGSGQTQTFASTGGQFTGLVNGQTYHFVVLAENELGKGEASLQSSPAIPDRVPDPPVSPVFTDYGNGRLNLQWSPPPSVGDYTAIQKYEVSIGGQNITTDGSTTTLVVSAGLQNGTDYTFKVRAQNKATTNNGWGDWSASSPSERPSTYPERPTAVAAANSGDGGAPRLTVTWSAPAFDGGRPIIEYRVCRVQDAACQTVTARQATFMVPRNSASSFTVTAFNTDKNRSNSDPSDPSAPVNAVGNPDAPVISSVTSGDKVLTVNAASANNSGCTTYSIQYRLNGGAWQASPTFTGLANGTAYAATAKTVLGAGCGTAGVTYESGISNSVNQTPYGPLRQPTITAGLSGNTITWNWNANRADDGRPGWSVVVTGECGGDTRPVGSYARDYGYSSGNRSCTITVSAPGVAPLSATAGQSTPPPPNPTISTSQGTAMGPGYCNSTCWRVRISGSNFAPNAAVRVYCEDAPGVFLGPFNFTTTNGAGAFGPTDSVCYHGSGAAFNQVVRVTDGTRTAEATSAW